MKVKHFFDSDTFTLTYVIYDEETLEGIVIDPVLDFDPLTGSIYEKNVHQLVSFLKSNNIELLAILETHAHADHLSGSQSLKKIFPTAKIGIGESIKIVQDTFKGYFHLKHLKTDGSQFDFLLKDFEKIKFGSLEMTAIPTPGHTPACMSFLFQNVVFTGDALFMPDYGTGRCDFPKGSAKTLYDSIIKNLYVLPDQTKVYVGHDYMPSGREMKFETTIGESKANNIHLRENTSENDYIQLRENRDKGLSAPRLLLPSIQVNIDAGSLPPVEENGKSYLKIPLELK